MSPAKPLIFLVVLAVIAYVAFQPSACSGRSGSSRERASTPVGTFETDLWVLAGKTPSGGPDVRKRGSLRIQVRADSTFSYEWTLVPPADPAKGRLEGTWRARGTRVWELLESQESEAPADRVPVMQMGDRPEPIPNAKGPPRPLKAPPGTWVFPNLDVSTGHLGDSSLLFEPVSGGGRGAGPPR